MTIPISLSYIVSRLENYEVSGVRAYPENDLSSYQPGSILEFVLPQTLLDLDTLQVSFEAGITATSDDRCGRLPEDIHLLCQRISIRIGSLEVDSGPVGWSQLMRKVKKLTGKAISATANPTTRRKHLSITGGNRDPEGIISKQNQELSDTQGRFIWDQFDKTFLGTASPRVVDFSLLPPVIIQFHLAGPNIVTGHNGQDANAPNQFYNSADPADLSSTGTITWEMRNPRLQVESVSFASAAYDSMINSQMSAGALMIPFKKLYQYTDYFFQTSMDMNVASTSVDRIWFSPQDKRYENKQLGLRRKFDHLIDGRVGDDDVVTLGEAGDAVAGPVGESYYDPRVGGIYSGYDGAPNKDLTYQFAVNNSLRPQYLPTREEWYKISHDAVSEDMCHTHSQPIQEWALEECLMCLRLNRKGSKVSEPSGINTNGVSTHFTLRADGMEQECKMNAYIECTCVLFCYPGQAISVMG